MSDFELCVEVESWLPDDIDPDEEEEDVASDDGADVVSTFTTLWLATRM